MSSAQKGENAQGSDDSSSTSGQDRQFGEGNSENNMSGVAIPNFANLPNIPPSFQFGMDDSYFGFGGQDHWLPIMGIHPSFIPFPNPRSGGPFQSFLGGLSSPPGIPSGLLPSWGYPFGEIAMGPPPGFNRSKTNQIPRGMNLPTPWGPPEMDMNNILSSMFPTMGQNTRGEFQKAMDEMSSILSGAKGQTTESKSNATNEQQEVVESESDEESDNQGDEDLDNDSESASESGTESESNDED